MCASVAEGGGGGGDLAQSPAARVPCLARGWRGGWGNTPSHPPRWRGRPEVVEFHPLWWRHLAYAVVVMTMLGGVAACRSDPPCTAETPGAALATPSSRRHHQ